MQGIDLLLLLMQSKPTQDAVQMRIFLVPSMSMVYSVLKIIHHKGGYVGREVK